MAKVKLEYPHRRKNPWTKSQIELFTMASLGLIFIFIFAYIPMFGIVLAFKDGDGQLNILEVIRSGEWFGFNNFIAFFKDPDFFNVMKNTLGLNFLQLLINFPAPIIFAVMLSEIQAKWFKKLIQTITYFPYFLSWIIFGGIIIVLLQEYGVVNSLLTKLNLISSPINFGEKEYFWGTIIITSLLKGLGWGAIIYIAAIAGIDNQLYEAARIDGANRFHRILHITLPSIAPTIVLFFILSLSGILNNGFDHIWVFQNQINLDTSEVLDTFIYKRGILTQQYSYTTAVGLFKSVVAIILLTVGNTVCKKITGNGVI